ncbi:MAG: SpoIIE family protein phosphatase [bacterium]|nr:SpoIIE family protein phosphatase [bacterium]
MTLRLKLILITIIEIVLTVTVAGYLAYYESHNEIEGLARDLTKSKTQEAFTLIEQNYKNGNGLPDELRTRISGILVAEGGYISVISNETGPERGKLVIHPSNEGQLLYNEEFPHIMDILDRINLNGQENGFGEFTRYRQQTEAKGRQSEMKIGYYKYFAPLELVVLATGYEQDVFASSEVVKQSTINVIIVVSIVGTIVVFFTIRQMFRPIQILIDNTKEVARGNWEVSIDHSSNDEIGRLSGSFNEMVKSLRDNAKIWHEFQLAKEMQTGMLPESCPELPGLKISAESIPAKQVGGDFYDFIEPGQKKLGLVIGDVSGHGVSSAIVMSAALSIVRFAAEEKERTDRVMSIANSRLKKDIKKNMFVALFYGVIDLAEMKINYTNAGLPLPLLWRDGKIENLPRSKSKKQFPLGIVDDCEYMECQYSLQSGDVLIFYSDGIIEAMNDKQQFYEYSRFVSSVEKNIQLEPDDMMKELINDMNDYIGNFDLYDDVTLVIAKIE